MCRKDCKRTLCIDRNWISHLICASGEIQTEADVKKGKWFDSVTCQRKESTPLLLTALWCRGRQGLQYRGTASIYMS